MSAHSRSLPRFLQPTASRLHQEEATMQQRKALSVRAHSRPPAMHFGSSSSLARSCTPIPPPPLPLECESTVQPLIHHEANIEPIQEHKVEKSYTSDTTLHKQEMQINENADVCELPGSDTPAQQEETFVSDTSLLHDQTTETHESSTNKYKRARSPAVINASEELETLRREEQQEEEQESKSNETLENTNRNIIVPLELREMLHTTSTKMEMHEEEEEVETSKSNNEHNETLTDNKNTIFELNADCKEKHETRFDSPRTLRFSRPPPLPSLSERDDNNTEVNNNDVINDSNSSSSSNNNNDTIIYTSHAEQREVQHAEEESLLEEMLPYSISDIVTPKQNKTREGKQELSTTRSNSTRVRSSRWANEFPLPRITWTAEQVEKVRLSLATSSSVLERAKSISGGISPLGSFPTPPSIHEWPRRRSIVLESDSDKENMTHTTDNTHTGKEGVTSPLEVKCKSNVDVAVAAAHVGSNNETNDVKETSHEASPMPTPERFAQSFEVTSNKRRCQRPSPVSYTRSLESKDVESGYDNENVDNDDDDDDDKNDNDKNKITLPIKEEEVKEEYLLDDIQKNTHVREKEKNDNDNITTQLSINENYVNINENVSKEFTKQGESDMSDVCQEVINVPMEDSNTVSHMVNIDTNKRDESHVLLEGHNDTATSEMSPIPTTSDLIHSVEASAEKRTCDCARPEPIDSFPTFYSSSASSLEHENHLARTLSPLPVPAEEHHVRFMRASESFENNTTTTNNNALIIHPNSDANPISTFSLFESEVPRRDHRPSPLSHSSSSKPTDAAFTSPQPEHSYSSSPWPTTEQIISSLHALRALHNEHRVAELHSVDDLEIAEEDRHNDHEEEEHQELPQREETELCVEETELLLEEEEEEEEEEEKEKLELPHQEIETGVAATKTEIATLHDVDAKSCNGNNTTNNKPTQTENDCSNSDSCEHHHEFTEKFTINNEKEELSGSRKVLPTTRTPSPTPSQHHYEVSLYASSEKRRRNKEVMEFEQEELDEVEPGKSVNVQNGIAEANKENSQVCNFARELSNVKSKSLSCKKENEEDRTKSDTINYTNTECEEKEVGSTENNDDNFVSTMERTLDTSNEQDANKINNEFESQDKNEEEIEQEYKQNDLEIQHVQNVSKERKNDKCSSENILQEKHTIGQVASPAFSEAFAESAMFVDCMSVPPTPQLAHLPPEYYEMENQIRALSHSRARHSLSQEVSKKSITPTEVEETHCSSIIVAVAGADTADVSGNSSLTATSPTSTIKPTVKINSNYNNKIISAPRTSHVDYELEKQTPKEVCKIDAWAFTGPSLLQEIENDTTEGTTHSSSSSISKTNTTIKSSLESITTPTPTTIIERTHIINTQSDKLANVNEPTTLHHNVEEQELNIEKELEQKEELEIEEEQEREPKKSVIIVSDVNNELSTHVNELYLPESSSSSSSSSLALASIQTPHIPFTSNVHMPLPLPKSQHVDYSRANSRNDATTIKSVNLERVNNRESPLPRPVSLRSQLNYSPYYVITPHGIANASAPTIGSSVSQHRAWAPTPSTTAPLRFHNKLESNIESDNNNNNYNYYNYSRTNNRNKTSLAYELSVSPLPSQQTNHARRDEMPECRRTPSFVLDPPTPVEKIEHCNTNCVSQEEESIYQLEDIKSSAQCNSNHKHDMSNETTSVKECEKGSIAEEVKLEFDSNDNTLTSFSRSFAISPIVSTNAAESYGRSSVLLSSNHIHNSEVCSSNLFDHLPEKSESRGKVDKGKENNEMPHENMHSNSIVASQEMMENKYKRKREEFDELEQLPEKNNHELLHNYGNIHHTTNTIKEGNSISDICERRIDHNNNAEINNIQREVDANMECRHSAELQSNKPAFPSALYAHRQREQLHANMTRYNTSPFMCNAKAYYANSKTLPMESRPVSSSCYEEECMLNRESNVRSTLTNTNTNTNTTTTTPSLAIGARVSTHKEHDNFHAVNEFTNVVDDKPEGKESERCSAYCTDTPMPNCATRCSHQLCVNQVNDMNTISHVSDSENKSTMSNFTAVSHTNKKKRLRVSTRLSAELRATLFKQFSPNAKQKEEKKLEKEEKQTEELEEEQEVKEVRRSTRQSTKVNDKRRSTQQASRKSEKEPAACVKGTNIKTSSASLPLSSLSTSTSPRSSKNSNETRTTNKRNSAKTKFVEENNAVHNVSKLSKQSKAEFAENKKKVIKKRQIGRRQTGNK